jgi:hypothetical protein
MPVVINGTTGVSLVDTGSVGSGAIVDGAIATVDIADNAITATKLNGTQSGSAPIYGARAWVNFNGTGTVAIKASGNVSSITDNGVGDYTVNFTTAMSNGNYSVATGALGSSTASAANQLSVTGAVGTGPTTKSTTAVRVISGQTGANVLVDCADCSITVFN